MPRSSSAPKELFFEKIENSEGNMGPILLCDKSTIHSLNGPALDLLHHYFSLLIPPILVVEVLGDLTKEKGRGKSPVGPSFVEAMARKLASQDVIPNVDFRSLIATELNGAKVLMSQRPIVQRGKKFIAPNGDKGVEVDTDPHEEALDRWRMGDFSNSEELISKLWRERKAEMNWSSSLKKLRGLYSESVKRKTSIEAILDFVDDIIAFADPAFLIGWFIEDFGGIGPLPFTSLDCPESLNQIPYTKFCIRASIAAHFAMKFELVSQKNDNLLDMEYIFYIPFCMAFSAQDKFSKAIARAFLTDKQLFLDCSTLKDDLSRIQEKLDSLSPEEKEAELKSIGPPQDESSTCFQAWGMFMKPDYREQKRMIRSPEMDAKIMQHVEMLQSGRGNEVSDDAFEFDDADFVFRKRTIRASDPCPCRSGRPWKECHGLEKDKPIQNETQSAIDQFRAFLKNMSPRELDLLSRFVDRANPPKTLYRYRRPNKWTLKELRVPEVHIAGINDMNDPFEYRAPLAVDIEKMRAAMYNYAREKLHLDDDAARAEAANVDQQLLDYFRKQIEALRTASGLICCSSDPLSNRMWAYYADGHKGICVGYNSDFSPFTLAQKVNYSDPTSALDLLDTLKDDPTLLAGHLSCRKGSEWEFEQEYRVPVGPFPKGHHRLLPVQQQAIAEIRLGAKISKSFKNEIIETVEKYSQKPRLIQMSCNTDNFRLIENILSD